MNERRITRELTSEENKRHFQEAEKRQLELERDSVVEELISIYNRLNLEDNEVVKFGLSQQEIAVLEGKVLNMLEYNMLSSEQISKIKKAAYYLLRQGVYTTPIEPKTFFQTLILTYNPHQTYEQQGYKTF